MTMPKIKKDLFEKCIGDSGNFGKLRARNDHYFIEPPLDGVPSSHMHFNGKEVIMWAINDYLGLANNAELRAIAADAVAKWGLSTPMGARLLTGCTEAHLKLEQSLAEYLQKPAAHLCNYGYLGVMGDITALIGKGDNVIIDGLSHSCMVEGAMLAQVKSGNSTYPYIHNDMEDLEQQLISVSEQSEGGALIVTEGVFSMHGDLADLKTICELKDKYGAKLYVDDAHGFGVLGDVGRGTGSLLGVQDKVDLYFGTFAKSFVAIGGITAGEKEVISYLSYNSKMGVSSKSLPLAYVLTLQATLDYIKTHPELYEKMWKTTRLLQNGLRELGFDLGETKSPITPIHLSSAEIETTYKIIHILREEYNVFVSAVTYPIVPLGTIIFRLIPTANHTEEDVAHTLKAFKEVRDKLNL